MIYKTEEERQIEKKENSNSLSNSTSVNMILQTVCKTLYAMWTEMITLWTFLLESIN